MFGHAACGSVVRYGQSATVSTTAELKCSHMELPSVQVSAENGATSENLQDDPHEHVARFAIGVFAFSNLNFALIHNGRCGARNHVAILDSAKELANSSDGLPNGILACSS